MGSHRKKEEKRGVGVDVSYPFAALRMFQSSRHHSSPTAQTHKRERREKTTGGLFSSCVCSLRVFLAKSRPHPPLQSNWLYLASTPLSLFTLQTHQEESGEGLHAPITFKSRVGWNVQYNRPFYLMGEAFSQRKRSSTRICKKCDIWCNLHTHTCVCIYIG